MGNTSLEKYNKLDNVGISIKLNKVCYFPGEEITGNIIISPKIYSIEDHRKYCELIITISERSQYTYRRGSDTETEVDDKTLINHKLRFSDFIEFGEVSRIIIPINYTLPKTTYPSIYINNHDYVKHFIMVEYPHFDAKRTNIFIVKNHLKYHSIKKHLLSPLNYQETFNKKKIFVKKGSCKIVINMPRTYFLYNEKVGYNIHLDCSILQIPVKKISVSFYRRIKKNNKKDLLYSRSSYNSKIFDKDYNLRKENKIFDIVDYIYYFDSSHENEILNKPIDVYNKLDKHGLYEIDDESLKCLYPSCHVGLINIEYSLKFKIYFDTIFTTDESIYLPIDFCDIIGNNNLNNNNIINYEQSAEQTNTHTDINTPIYNANLINNNIINNNFIDEDSGPPSNPNMKIDTKKNYLEDKGNLDLKDWVII